MLENVINSFNFKKLNVERQKHGPRGSGENPKLVIFLVRMSKKTQTESSDFEHLLLYRTAAC